MSFTERDRKAGAGCLVAAGLIGLLPALAITLWLGQSSLHHLQSGVRSLQWSSLKAFATSWWQLIRYGNGAEAFVFPAFLILAGYFLLLWQWISFTCGRRLLFSVSARLLWAVTSGYFAAVTTFFIHAFYQESQRLADLNADYNPLDALVWALLICLVPLFFLSISVPLWLSTPPK